MSFASLGLAKDTSTLKSAVPAGGPILFVACPEHSAYKTRINIDEGVQGVSLRCFMLDG